MRFLIGGEYSGTVRDAFIARGYDAMSCDFSATATPGPHYQGHWKDIWHEGFDGALFHPTCTRMANSGAKHLFKDMKKENGLNGERWLQMGWDAWEFWNLLENCPIPRVAVENPVMLGYAQLMIGKKPSQTIQPWQFGHLQMKATCLWLKRLPKLVPTDIVGPPPEDSEQRKLWQDVWRMAPTKDPEERRMARSKTLPGIADAYAEQWGAHITQDLIEAA